MSTHIEIVRLFKSLSKEDRSMVLQELSQSSTGETFLIEGTTACCPHCESKLFVKNGK